MFNFFKKAKKVISNKVDDVNCVASEVNFDRLSSQCKNDDCRENMDALWSAVYKLKKWWFVKRVNKGVEVPFIGVVDGRPFIMAFTDEGRARDFAKSNKLLNEQGIADLMGFPTGTPDYYTQFIRNGVFGILFNNGEYGFFAPLQNVPAMHDYFLRKDSTS